MQVQCENLTLSKLHNIGDFAITQHATYATDLSHTFHLKTGCYTLEELCDQLSNLSTLQNLGTFKIDKPGANKYEGIITIVAAESKLKDELRNLSYIIPNSLAYILGKISYPQALQNGLDSTTEIVVRQDFIEPTIQLDASLIKHLHFLQISSNFMLYSDKSISYIYLTKDDLIEIFNDKLSLKASNLPNNIISLQSIGNIYIDT